MVFPGYARQSGPDPVNAQDLSTKNYVDRCAFFSITGNGSTQAIPSASITKVTGWAAPSYNIGSGTWNSSTSVYTVGVRGLYRVTCNMGWQLYTAWATPNTVFSANLYLNGSQVAAAGGYAVNLSVGNYLPSSVTKTMLCVPGDQIDFRAGNGHPNAVQQLALQAFYTFAEIEQIAIPV
jgi:hypothetical protein